MESEHCGELVLCCTTGMAVVSSMNCASGANTVSRILLNTGICLCATVGPASNSVSVLRLRRRHCLLNSLWHDWNVYHSVDEGILNQTRSTSTVLCTTATVELVRVWNCVTNELRYHAVIAQWSYFVWSVAHVKPVGAEPPTASSVEHPVYCGGSTGTHECVVMSRVTS